MHWTTEETAEIRLLYDLYIRMAFYTSYHPELTICNGAQESK